MSRSCNLLIVVLVLGAGAVSSLAQLSPADIAALRAQGEREGWTFVVTENPATARPLSALCGLAEPPNWQETAQFDPCEGVIDELPRIFDWRDVDGRNYCPPIRDQRSCGSCWAFASVGPVECAIKIKDDVFVDLSEQWLVSCNQSGWSCAGGWWSHDYYRGATDPCGGTGAVLEAAFPYVASNVPCRCPYPHVYRLIDWRYIGTGGGVPSVSSMKQAIYDRGPVCVAVYVDNAFQSYGGGVFNACANGTVNHGVVLVGWNDDDQCWLMRNSWGAGWGEDGYMRIKYNCSRIGYGATYVVYGSMQVNPQDGAELIGEPGGPFNPPSASYTLTNNSSVPFSYQVMKTQPWLTITNGAGTIPAGGAVQFSVSANSAANSLPLGVYEDTVTIQNMTNHNGDTTRRVYLRVGVPRPLYTWNMDTDPGWQVDGQWAWGPPTGGAGANGGPDPTAGFTGANVYGYNLAGGYPDLMPQHHLTTPAINCVGIIQSSLRFRRWLGVEEHYWDEAYLQASTDRETWTTLWTNPGAVLDDQQWVHQLFDVHSIVDGQPAVYFRWTMGPSDWSINYCGWNIDDVELWGVRATPTNPGDVNCDGAVTFLDINPFVLLLADPGGYAAQFPNCPVLNGDCNGDGRVDFSDINPFVALLSR